jgi:hypothetical protein
MWSTTTIHASTGSVGRHNDLAVDAFGGLIDATGGFHIAYHDTTSGDLKYAARCPGGIPE